VKRKKLFCSQITEFGADFAMKEKNFEEKCNFENNILQEMSLNLE
jgi:hypothetical protein